MARVGGLYIVISCGAWGEGCKRGG